MVTKDEIISTLKKCFDPELNIDVHTLGLIYDISIIEDKINIKMTLTTPFCPYGPFLIGEIKRKITESNKVKEVNIDLVFDPPWQPPDDVRASLGI
ncbi:MAG: metal-sulfur cluster assembly factor [Nanoarchaeota archaeon]